MEKYARIDSSVRKIDNLLIEHFSECCQLKESVKSFQESPSEESAEDLQDRISNISAQLEILKNALTTFVKTVVSDEELEEIDIIIEESGNRLI